MTQEYDAIIIGTGQAGPPLAGEFDGRGLKVAIIERHQVGGSCVNHGCIPTKALVASAQVAHQARRAGDFGIQVTGRVGADMKRVKARMREISGQSNESVTQWLEGMENVDLIRGHARLEGPGRVRVGSDLLTAPKIFLNVGARARVPEMPGLDEIDYLTSTGLLKLEELPEHLVVIGGGYIGLEFAQMYRRFGSRVTVVEMGPRLMKHEDEDVAEAVGEILAEEGIELRLNAECIGFSPRNSGIAVQVECGEGPPEVVGSHVLLAVGRIPNTDDLGLEKAGIELDKGGYVPVDDRLRSPVESIWAIGDCNGKGAFTHTSYNDYEIVANQLFGDGSRKVSDRITCYGLYIDPPLGRIGLNESQALQSGRKALMGKRPMSKVGRAKEFGQTQGFIKILVDPDSEEILGAAILGLSGDEAVHCLLDVMYAKTPYTVISQAVHIHPTVSELIPTVLQSLEPLEDEGD
ncbi:MAG TPA: FAD-containing oxidoreductase [Acidobacteriota bacterium]|nr:FAD-containing oxidoreductase [Acidobacteriota bacterium]